MWKGQHCLVHGTSCPHCRGGGSWRGNASMPVYCFLPHRKICDYQYQKCRVDRVREPGWNLEEDQMERRPMGTDLFPIRDREAIDKNLMVDGVEGCTNVK